jgi:hypothetical protein
VPSRRSEPSIALAIFSAPSPPAKPTLVAISTSSRRPRRASHSPMIVSLSPPLLPGAQAE